jgi:hypothetical protein
MPDVIRWPAFIAVYVDPLAVAMSLRRVFLG